MYNEQLGERIVQYLYAAFPDKVQLDTFRNTLSEFSTLPEQEWLKALDALQQDGRVEFKPLRTGFDNALQMVMNIVISNTERKRFAQSGNISSTVPLREDTDPERSKRVWVVHGRAAERKLAMFTFLLSLGLKPISFNKARELTGKAMPHVSEILSVAFKYAQAVVVLLTPDDEGRLRPKFVKSDDEPSDTDLTPQPRLNVIFEAGMAAVSHPDQTILVKFEYVRPFSDVAGFHYVVMDGSAVQRRELALRLKTAGCPVNLEEDEHWLNAGDFFAETTSASKSVPSELKKQVTAYVSSLSMEWEAQKKQRPVLLGPLWEIVTGACQQLLEFHTQAVTQGAHDLAAKLAEGYQALKQYDGAERTATLDFDDLEFITEVDNAIERLKTAA